MVGIALSSFTKGQGMNDHLAHLALILIPVVLVVFFRSRALVPAALAVLVLHHHLDALPGDAAPIPPPICCTAAQSTEPACEEAPTGLRLVLVVPFRPALRKTQEFLAEVPGIRAPPRRLPLTPVSLTLLFRAA